MASEVSCGAGVVVVHAVEAAGALPHEHHGHLGLAQEGTVAGCEDRGEEHDAVHGMSLEEFEVLELALGVVIGVGQEHLAAAFTQHLADTGGDAADGLGVDLGPMTPTMRVEPVRSARACAEGAYPVRSIAWRIRSRLSSAR